MPFCVRKCSYCDFYSLPARSEAGSRNLMARYGDAVLREAGGHAGESFDTLYLGGGTPSLLGSRPLEGLIAGLRDTLDLSGCVEATMEVNPESATGDLLAAARRSGITRVSVGVQSLSDGELTAVGRVHHADQALEAVRRAVGSGFASVSADLIVGLPRQTWPSLRASIEALLRLGVRHLSLYCLSVEEGTPLAWRLPPDLPSDDMQAELFERACSLLVGRGFAHYEISNFAPDGHECRHNLNYWRGGEYLGLGPAAASHLGGRRYRNVADLDAYLRGPAGVIEDVEELDAPAKACEEAMLRLRLLREGVSVGDLRARFGYDNVAPLVARLDGLACQGLLVSDGSSYRLPLARVLTANPILAEVLSPLAGFAP